MTPNLSSGTQTTRRNWTRDIKAWLTRRFGLGLPPISATSATPSAPHMPFLSQEPVSEANRPGAEAQAVRTRYLMDRICAENNANVTRDYGTHREDLSHRVRPGRMTAEEMADAARLLDVRVATTKPRPAPPPTRTATRTMSAAPTRAPVPSPAYDPHQPLYWSQFASPSPAPSPSPCPAPSYDRSSSYSSSSYDSGSSCSSSSYD